MNITGDWVISTALVYSNETINVTGSNGTNSTDGNITITATGSLTLDNVTLLLPASRLLVNNGVLDATDSTFDGPRWYFGLYSTATLTRVHIQNATHSITATVGGTWVSSAGVTFDHVTWDASAGTSVVHLARPINFTDNTLRGGTGVYLEVNPSFANQTVQIANNSFSRRGFGNFYTVYVRGAPLGFAHAFDINGNTFLNEYFSIIVRRADPDASYLVRNNYFESSGGFSSAIEAGYPAATWRFDGTLTATNNTVVNASRGIRLAGVASYTTVMTVDRLVTVNVTTAVTADSGTIIVTNSTLGASGNTYAAAAQGHILIYSTADSALDTATPGTNASIEHFAFLNVTSATWQGAVPMVANALSLRNATDVANLVLDIPTWTPSYVVNWGVYGGGLVVDNRDLRPVVVDGAHTFGCAPMQFYFSEGMSPMAFVCQDDSPPQLTFSSPAVDAYYNRTIFQVTGNISEAGSGLASFEYSLDNTSFETLAPGANNSSAWSTTIGPLADGTHSVYLRAVDRTGNIQYAKLFPLHVDTEAPPLVLGSLPRFANGTSWVLSGSSEPFATLTVRRAYGWNQTVTLGANGSFAFTIPLDEGQNTYSLRIVDRAGNWVEGDSVITLDTVPPQLAALLDSQPLSALWTANLTVHVSGTCEPSATVELGGATVTRAGSTFGADLALAPGRNDLDVVCTDEAGNTAHWYGFAFLDDEPPSLEASVDGAVSLGPGRYLVVSSLVAIDGTVADVGSGLGEVSVNGAPVAVSGDGHVTVSLEVPEGETTVLVMAVDRVGNTASVSFAVVSDTTRPSATFEWVESGAPILDLGGRPSTRGSQVLLRIVLSEPARVLFADTSLDLPEGETLQPVELVPGPNNLSITFSDTAGNSGPPVDLQIFKDDVPPETTIYTPAQGAVVLEPAVEVTGQTEPGAVVRVGGLAVSVTTTGDFHIFVELAVGENHIAVEAEDALGNVANVTVTVEYAQPQATPVVGPSGGLELLLLLVGLLAGAVGGALAMRGRAGALRRGGRDESAGDQAPPTGPAPGARGPQNPRGPAPPP